MPKPLYYVGTREETAHHAAPLNSAFDVRIVSADEVVRVAQPGEVCVFFNEYFPRFRDACIELKARQCPTLYAIDGILEWRNSWEVPENGDTCLWVMRPVLSHKVACIGRSQARVLESWGNLGKCEVAGVPRFDRLLDRKPRARRLEEPFRVLVMTAKCPGFTPEQTATTVRSLKDLKNWFEQHSRVGSTAIEVVWRLTSGLEQTLGIQNRLQDTTGADLATVLNNVDAVIATPSTAMLEAMLQGLPVAILDYHNRPHYVPAPWRITAQSHLATVIPELINSPAAALLYQDSILHEALECRSPATSRLVELIDKMHVHARQCLSKGTELAFPRRILSDPQDGHHLPEVRGGDEALFPSRVMITGNGRYLTPPAAAAMARYEGCSVDVTSNNLPSELIAELAAKEPPSGRTWRNVADEFESRWHDATKRLRAERDQARRELSQLRHRMLSARLTRLGNKLRRLMPNWSGLYQQKPG